uniref:Uncharacterized protein n=1 Tax=Arundo donax TaxID=35708 RepID=A0A0A9HCQ8_ARUDO
MWMTVLPTRCPVLSDSRGRAFITYEQLCAAWICRHQANPGLCVCARARAVDWSGDPSLIISLSQMQRWIGVEIPYPLSLRCCSGLEWRSFPYPILSFFKIL